MADTDRIDTETQADLLEHLANAFREKEYLSDEGRGIELTLLDAAKRLRELEAEVERLGDCERIAWAALRGLLAVNRPAIIYQYPTKLSFTREWVLLVNRGKPILLGPCGEQPVLTDEARAIIDTAMKEGE